MKSETLHKLPTLSTFLLMLCGCCVWSLPCKCVCVCVCGIYARKQHTYIERALTAVFLLPVDNRTNVVQPQRPVILIQNNLKPAEARDYQITIPKAAQPDEPCLTISWKTNPDGTGPDAPRIYFVDGYFHIASSQLARTQP
ncbi:hypothetical protein KR222_008137 [Zaprionus bogoriensis]|nr:hypothetical protein KR222_008137 [Zaprionus bogoriensis]